MTTRTLPGNPPLDITLRRSARARRISLRVSQLDGRVTLSMPRWTPEAEALAFAQEKTDWIRTAQAKSTPIEQVSLGSTLPFEGKDVTVVAGDVQAVRIDGKRLIAPPQPDLAGARVAAYLKLAAGVRLRWASDRFCSVLGRSYTRFTLRDTRSRWGSCSSEGGLMYSWRLIMAPPEVLTYVAAHEVAHLVEMNHSAAYWAVVERLMPDYRGHRRWLRQHGAGLHRYDFGS